MPGFWTFLKRPKSSNQIKIPQLHGLGARDFPRLPEPPFFCRALIKFYTRAYNRNLQKQQVMVVQSRDVGFVLAAELGCLVLNRGLNRQHECVSEGKRNMRVVETLIIRNHNKI